MIDNVKIGLLLPSDCVPSIVAKCGLTRRDLRTADGKTSTEYETANERLTGVYIKIDEKGVTVQCSAHKVYSKYLRPDIGRLENVCEFTMADARRVMLEWLPLYIGVPDLSGALVQYMEIGMTLPMNRPAVEYIARMVAVGRSRELLIAPDQRRNTQRVTSRSRNSRVTFKVYDKAAEMVDRRRCARSAVSGCNLLRIETIYRRPQSMTLADVFAKSTQLLTRFYRDWRCVEFVQFLDPPKGEKPQRVEWATEILSEGVERFADRVRLQYADGVISRRAYRSAMDFAKYWPTHRGRYATRPSPHEVEFVEMLEKWQRRALLPGC